jgi:hypothetical protein
METRLKVLMRSSALQRFNMKTKIHQRKNRSYLLPVLAAALFLTVAFPLVLTARGAPADNGEIAYATVSVGTRTYKDMRPNQDSRFSRIYNIQPLATVGIEINYPNGNKGDKVVLEVLDGGVLGNGKGVQVISLDGNRNISFYFQVSDSPGLYRVILRKAHDLKTIQLWVGASPAIDSNNPD